MADNMPWFRFYSEAMGDRKLSHAARMCGMSRLEINGAWALILCAANESPVRGSLYVTFLKRYMIDDVTDLLGCSNDQAQNLLDSFVEMEMLELSDGAYHVKNWEKRQFQSDNSTKRVQKHRENSENKEGNGGETFQKRYSNVSVTPPDTDTDTEADVDSSTRGANEIFRTYEREIGPLTPIIGDQLQAALVDYPEDWIVQAIRESALSNARNWKYTEAILKRWKVDGFQSQKKPSNGNGKLKPVSQVGTHQRGMKL